MLYFFPMCFNNDGKLCNSTRRIGRYMIYFGSGGTGTCIMFCSSLFLANQYFINNPRESANGAWGKLKNYMEKPPKKTAAEAPEAIFAASAPVIGETPEPTGAADAPVSGTPGFVIAVNAPVSAAPGHMVAGASKDTEKGKRCMKTEIEATTSEAWANLASENASLKVENQSLKTENDMLKAENKRLKTSSEAGASGSSPSRRFAPSSEAGASGSGSFRRFAQPGESFEDGIYPRPPPARQDVPKAAEVETIPIPPARQSSRSNAPGPWCLRIERRDGSNSNINR